MLQLPFGIVRIDRQLFDEFIETLCANFKIELSLPVRSKRDLLLKCGNASDLAIIDFLHDPHVLSVVFSFLRNGGSLQIDFRLL